MYLGEKSGVEGIVRTKSIYLVNNDCMDDRGVHCTRRPPPDDSMDTIDGAPGSSKRPLFIQCRQQFPPSS